MPDPTPEPAELGKLLDLLLSAYVDFFRDFPAKDAGNDLTKKAYVAARAAVWAEVQRLQAEADFDLGVELADRDHQIAELEEAARRLLAAIALMNSYGLSRELLDSKDALHDVLQPRAAPGPA